MAAEMPARSCLFDGMAFSQPLPSRPLMHRSGSGATVNDGELTVAGEIYSPASAPGLRIRYRRRLQRRRGYRSLTWRPVPAIHWQGHSLLRRVSVSSPAKFAGFPL